MFENINNIDKTDYKKKKAHIASIRKNRENINTDPKDKSMVQTPWQKNLDEMVNSLDKTSCHGSLKKK